MADETVKSPSAKGDHNKQSVKSKATSDPPKKNMNKKESIIPFHQQISDAGQFSYAALYATALHVLFGEEHNRKFREESLAVVLISLEQPQQVCESVRAILQGQGLDDMDPFIDMLLAEDLLKSGCEPLVSELLAVAVGQGRYDSRMRVIIKHLAWRLHVSWDVVIELESNLAETLILAQYESTEEEKKEREAERKRSKYKRYALIGLATVGGGTLIGLTGGLAAPLVAAGAGAIIGGTGAAMLGTTAGVALIGSLFGVAGAGLTGTKMRRRIGSIEEFEFEPLTYGSKLRVETCTNQLHITIALTGWLTNQHRDFREPWHNLAESKEQYTLKWETKYLVQLGEAIDYVFNSAVTMAAQEALKMTVLRDFREPWHNLAESKEQYTLKWETKYLVQLGEAIDYVFNSAVTMAAQEALKMTVLRGLLAAVAWPATLLSASSIIDNPWSVAMERSQSAGKLLAEVLLARDQGNRPVSLIGFSLGARVIFFCLEELCKRKGSEGIIEDVIILGGPVTGDPKTWSKLDRVVAGKIVNGYCKGDWLLKFLYRTSHVKLNVAGLGPVMWENRRMYNLDLSSVVEGHLDYRKKLDTILKAVGVRTRDEVSRSMSSLKISSSSSASHMSQSSRQAEKEVEAMSTSMDDLSSSDEEMYCHVGLVQSHSTSQDPVVLEDYTGGGGGGGAKVRKSSGLDSSKKVQRSDSDRTDNSTEEQQGTRTVIPESASFDSGVEINRAESEARDGGDTSARMAHSSAPVAGAAMSQASSQTSAGKGISKGVEPADLQDGVEASAVLENMEKDDSKSQDRIGDAAANRKSPEDSKDEDEEGKFGGEDEDVASNLQRKKMFDSMYRLVLDDDLLEMMNEEDVDDEADDDLLAEKEGNDNR
ncbi:transmembrane and coiled-coil domain-containing protein 4 [Plakobranchus ocellatus]|uniref:Transmembrane and coiled-coil domain-containing protein 4 n=1 Tax=Plakobranchus ocellatus TaxID=259542 RepID=A0AAV4A765_9GAST|nr:transmembrane and coiled-coil domain-containing protein 4 [Plakobranchus ocellatus]